ncbi:hypothetical protein GJ496_001467 [Pomphorhynchus laevis]|nr:hypothetical protein GJ496_001467 [Pomphorhynchus laevis]
MHRCETWLPAAKSKAKKAMQQMPPRVLTMKTDKMCLKIICSTLKEKKKKKLHIKAMLPKKRGMLRKEVCGRRPLHVTLMDISGRG